MFTTAKKQRFFTAIRSSFFNGKLSQGQVEGIDVILNEWNKRSLRDIRQLSYILATVYHETAKTMQPIEEYGRGKNKAYGQKFKMGGGANKRIPYTRPNKLYYGRGFVQITWYENYERMGKLLNVDLLNKPELALDLNVATQILFEGMTTGTSSKGDFTGRCLEQYFNAMVNDPLNARRIINGIDQADLIAEYHYKFFKALE